MSKQQRDALDAAIRSTPFDTTWTSEQQRRGFDERFTAPLAEDVAATEIALGGVPALRLDVAGAPGVGALLYLHGGGYVVGSALSGARLATELARRTGAVAYSLGYRLAPDHRFPAAVEDGLAAYRALLDSGVAADEIVIGGDSAGGGLALATLIAARDAGLPQPAGALLFSPWVDLTLTAASYESKQGIDPLFDHAAMSWFTERYLDGADAAHPLASPALADLTGLPPLLIQVGSHEVLLDDSVLLAQTAGHSDVEVTLEIGAELPHVFQNAYAIVEEADAALGRAAAFVAGRLRTSELIH